MSRVLVFLEDYNEVLFLETFLKKLGFDVLGLVRPISLARKLLGFSPQLIITQVAGKQWSGEASLRSLREEGRRILPQCKILGLVRGGDSGIKTDSDFFDATARSPVNPTSLIMAVADLLKLDEKALLEKYKSLSNYQEIEVEMQELLLSPSPKESPRLEAYSRFLSQQAPLKGETLKRESIEKRAMAMDLDSSMADKIEATHAEKVAYLVELLKSSKD